MPDGPNSLLLRNLRLARIYRRRMMRSFAFDRHGCVAIVEEVCYEPKEELSRSTLNNHMMCRKALMALILCSCPICVWHMYVDDE